MSDTDLATLLKRHEAFWTRGSVDTPLLNTSTVEEEQQETDQRFAPLTRVRIPAADGSNLLTRQEPISPDMIDPSLMLDHEEFPRWEGDPDAPGPWVIDDLLVRRVPVTAMVWVESILGCPVIPRLDTGSIYSAPWLDGPGDIDKIPPPEKSPWLELLKRYTRLLVENSNGRYQVSKCLMRGPVDLVSALLGHPEMCLAMYDEPKALRALVEFCTETFIMVAKAQHDLYVPLEGGHTHSLGVWAPGSTVTTQCDVVSSMSAESYKEFFFPGDREISKAFDYSMVHLHSGYLHHIDVLLEEKYPTIIQVALDTGSTPNTVRSLMPFFKHVLEEKPLAICGPMTRAEVDECLDQLPAKGLYISSRSTRYDRD